MTQNYEAQMRLMGEQHKNIKEAAAQVFQKDMESIQENHERQKTELVAKLKRELLEEQL